MPESRWSTVAPSDCTASYSLSARRPSRIASNLTSAADAARLARPQLETVEQFPSSEVGRPADQVCMNMELVRTASTPHSISHYRCLPVRPDSGAGFIVSAHYATPAHMG